ncbi:MAG: hypothetical protein EWM72_00927 [Nitrospira sp.]|nr:MAG: hypothetical protein EWM72_00927 [Nitrospira sp.]
MNGRRSVVETFRQHPSLQATIWVIDLTLLLLIGALPVRAEIPRVPWECSNYEGDTQTRCLNTFIEFQREKIGQLEGQLQAQQDTVGQLKNQVDRQAAATADLQRQLSDRPTTTVAPDPYPYVYFHPPGLGFGLYLGRPWIYGYGPPYYYRPYWGPLFYRHWGHRR